jgi:hypothetical protein
VVAGVALVLCPVMASAAAPSEAGDVFRQFASPLEEALGVHIEASKVKLGLLSGDVTVKRVSLSHPEQGRVLSIRDLAFPFGALAGAVDPSECTATAGVLELGVDFSAERFWVLESGPVAGAPDLSMGRLAVHEGRLRLEDGKAPAVVLDGFSGKLCELDLPAEHWSAAKVPDGRWASVFVEGGTASLDGLPYAAEVDSATVRVRGAVVEIAQVVGRMGGGGLSVSGEVRMAAGRPVRYDLVVSLASVRIARTHVEGVVDGKLRIQGPPGKVRIEGTLELSEAGTFERGEWEVEGCSDEVKLDVTLARADGDALTLRGSLCDGRITEK